MPTGCSLLGLRVIANFREVWVVDFEFNRGDGEGPNPVCMVALELFTGRLIRMRRNKLRKQRTAPFDTGPNALFVAYFASAELGCFLSLGWKQPVNIVDLFAERRVETNGHYLITDNTLIGALAARGLTGLDSAQKDAMRMLVLEKDWWTDQEVVSILDYCTGDVSATSRLLTRMVPEIDWPRALLRGRYMLAVAQMEHTGIPTDLPLLKELQKQ